MNAVERALWFIESHFASEIALEDVAKAADMCYGAAKAGKSDPKTHWLGVRE